jgi:hypothetical protein
MTKHPELAHIEEFVRGQLDEAESETMLAHLATCETCIDVVDQLWTQVGVGSRQIKIQDPDYGTTRSIHKGLMHRIHIQDLGYQLIKLSIVRPVQVVVSFLRVLTVGQKAGMKEESSNGFSNS